MQRQRLSFPSQVIIEALKAPITFPFNMDVKYVSICGTVWHVSCDEDFFSVHTVHLIFTQPQSAQQLTLIGNIASNLFLARVSNEVFSVYIL